MAPPASRAAGREPGPLVGVTAALLSGALLALASALEPVWWAAWIAPVPLLWVVRGKPQRGFWLGLVTGIVAGATEARYEFAILGPIVAVGIALLRALGWAFLARVSAAAESRLAPSIAVFALPACWAALEMLVTALSPHGSAGSIAYGQYGFPAALQLAALGGLPALTFCMGLFASALALLLRGGSRNLASVVPALALPALVLAAALIWGDLRRQTDVTSGSGAATVAMIATDGFEGSPADWERVWPLYASAISQAAARGASLAVLPEKIVRLGPSEYDAAVGQIGALAREARIDLVVGLLVDDGAVLHNRALFAEASGRISSYDKEHLVPGWEDRIAPGHGLLVVDTAYGRVGLAVCKDLDFPDLALAYAHAGAQRLLVPAWDFRGSWGSDGERHAQMAVVRGIEGGFDVVRSARVGLATLSDTFGELIARAPSTPEVTVTLGSLPPVHAGSTPYARGGHLFGWMCVAVAAGYVVASGSDARWRRRRRIG